MNEWHQVEGDAQSVNGGIETGETPFDQNVEQETRTPADQEEDYDQNQHLDDLLAGLLGLAIASAALTRYVVLLEMFCSG